MQPAKGKTMTINHLQQTDSSDVSEHRAQWTCPEVRRLGAGSAESSFVSGIDGATQNAS
jgi:hypothetical protein